MHRFIRIAAVVLLIFLLGNIIRIWDGQNAGDCIVNAFGHCPDTLTACINVDDGIYASKGFLTGFQYTMLTAFADSLDMEMEFSGTYGHPDCWEMLSDHAVDLVVVNAGDTVPDMYADKVVSSMPFGDYAWMLRGEDSKLLDEVNLWLGLMVKTRDYTDMRSRFFRKYSLDPYYESGAKVDRISPYDRIIKEQSRLIGWDWRLLAAVIFKESRFSMDACSKRGAIGLMQVKSSTAEVYGITDLFNPEENVRAGVRHLMSIKSRYEKTGMDSANIVKFTLAAYNAGESRMEDCMNFAKAQGRDSLDWNSVAELIPLMSMPEYYEDADYLRHGKFNGRETILYVNDVLLKYEEYQATVR